MLLPLKAHAKINLGLRLGPKRPDGYHELSSFFQEVSLADDLVLQTTSDSSLTLSCDDPALPTDDTNLCLQAAKLLQRETGYSGGVHLELHKRIPVGSGLGGGSSDAAAVLRGLNHLWDLHLKPKALLSLALKLGSDVPFFLYGGCCLVAGRGEILRKIAPFIFDPMVLVIPQVAVATAWAYKILDNYRLTSASENIKFQRFSKKDLQTAAGFQILKNDFEPPLWAHFPILLTVKEQLLQEGAYWVSLSGSGSALYGVFSSWESAQSAASRFSALGQIEIITIKQNNR